MVAQPSFRPAWVPAGGVPAAVAPPLLPPAPRQPPSSQLDSDALKLAIGDGSLELFYQPEVDLRSGEIAAMEGLLRWRHPSIGVVPPHGFLPLAQRSGLMGTVETWVLAVAATTAASWLRLPGPMRTLWVNVSMTQLTDEAFPVRFSHAVKSCSLPEGALGLEISEQVLQRLGDRAMPLLARLRSLGAALVADDFSSYYTSLGTIGTLPLDGLKLSHRFVRATTDEAHYGRTLKVINQAHERGMYVVAEGVETLQEKSTLAGLGCDRAHGYLYSPPVPADQARHLLKQRTVCSTVDGVVVEESS